MSKNFIETVKSHFVSAHRSKKVRKIVMCVILVVLIIFGAMYLIYENRYVSTEDAYVNANVSQIASRVSGQILHLNVTNNQLVAKGQVLFELDQLPFIVSVEKAKAEVAIAKAHLNNTNLNTSRILSLVKLKFMANQEGDNASSGLKAASANVKLAEASLKQAELNLNYTVVVAPTNGLIANLSLREGNVISANQSLFALVNNEHYWVDANFKETEIQKIRPGQNAKIILDMYSKRVFHGIVESISGGSGTVFSLLPPQNAIGNWVKVSQRVPVKVRILNQDSANYPLRIGTTATVTVDTKLPKASI